MEPDPDPPSGRQLTEVARRQFADDWMAAGQAGCDAMRIGPDVLPESPDEQPYFESLIRITGIRSWMNGRLWVNDPDCLVARPEIVEREALATYLEGYAGAAFSSDRLAALDARGLALTRRVLESARQS